VAPEDTWAEMKDSTEEVRTRSGGHVKLYVGAALVAIAVLKLVCNVTCHFSYALCAYLVFPVNL